MRDAPAPPLPRPEVPARCKTVGQKWKWKRNIAIAVASRAGLSHRFLADVFDLPPSRISAILARLRAASDGDRETERADSSDPRVIRDPDRDARAFRTETE